MKTIINKFGIDKIAHFSLGGLMCALVTIVYIIQEGVNGSWTMVLYPIIGSIWTFVLSIAKEQLFDSVFDWKDIAAAMIGCATVFVAVAIGVLFYLSSL